MTSPCRYRLERSSRTPPPGRTMGPDLAITRGYAQHNEEMALAVVPADASGPGVESIHGLTGCCDTILQWSPDDTSILVMPEDGSDRITTQHLLLDPVDRPHRDGAVDGDEPSGLAANRSLVGALGTATLVAGLMHRSASRIWLGPSVTRRTPAKQKVTRCSTPPMGRRVRVTE